MVSGASRALLYDCLLAAVALQKIHRIDGNCVAAHGVSVVFHGDLLKSVGNRICQNWKPSPCVVTHYITGMTAVSFPYMLWFRRVAKFL